MKQILMTSFYVLIVTFMLPIPAYADCSDPVGKEGEMIYNVDHKTMQFCDGTSWFSMKAVAPSAGGGGGGITVQFTTAKYHGHLGGLDGANAKCQSQFPGSYFCPSDDYLRSGITSSPHAWVDSPGGSYGVNGQHSCHGWYANSGYGGISNRGGLNCGNELKLACCTRQ